MPEHLVIHLIDNLTFGFYCARAFGAPRKNCRALILDWRCTFHRNTGRHFACHCQVSHLQRVISPDGMSHDMIIRHVAGTSVNRNIFDIEFARYPRRVSARVSANKVSLSPPMKIPRKIFHSRARARAPPPRRRFTVFGINVLSSGGGQESASSWRSNPNRRSERHASAPFSSACGMMHARD